VTDAPKKTTVYGFDLWPRGTDHGGKKKQGAPAAGRQHYTVAVHVYEGTFPPLQTYQDWLHWRIDYVAGWKRYAMPQIDPANNALLYFQPEEDSVERLAVAIVPTKATTCAELMHEVMLETPSQYDVLEDVSQKETTQDALPATWLTFKGIDRAEPDIATRSLVMALVRDGKGYVISARARAGEFDKWERLLRCLVRSFAFTPKAHSAPNTPSGQEETKKAQRHAREER